MIQYVYDTREEVKMGDAIVDCVIETINYNKLTSFKDMVRLKNLKMESIS